MGFSQTKFRRQAGYVGVFIILSIAALALIGSHTHAAEPAPCVRQSTAKAVINVSNNVATARVSIPKKCGPTQISFASYKAPNGTNGKPYANQSLFAVTTKTFQPGRNTISVNLPDCHYQVDLVRGTPISDFTNTTYHKQNRFLGAVHGGSKSCSEKPVVITQVVEKPVVTTKIVEKPVTKIVEKEVVREVVVEKPVTVAAAKSSELPAAGAAGAATGVDASATPDASIANDAAAAAK